MAGAVTDQDGVVGTGREVVATVKRLVLLEIELIKAQARATAMRLAAGIGMVLLALLASLFFVVFLIGTVNEGTSLADNGWILGFAAGMPVTALFSWLGLKMPRILNVIVAFVALVLGLLTVAALIAFMVAAIADPGTNPFRRGWGISALSFFVLLFVSGGGGAVLIVRAISGGKETAAGVKDDVTWAVDDVKSRRWRG